MYVWLNAALGGYHNEMFCEISCVRLTENTMSRMLTTIYLNPGKCNIFFYNGKNILTGII